MASSVSQSPTSLPHAGHFAATRWSVVLAAVEADPGRAEAALGELCVIYWQPIYVFVRRQGYCPPDAQDLTQEFFVRLLSKNYLGAVQRSRGRFRSFLLAAVKHFLSNERDKARAGKRGGGCVVLPFADAAEIAYGAETSQSLSADKLFDRRWAHALLDHVLAALRAEYVRDGKEDLFEALKGTLTGDRSALGYKEFGAALGLSEGAVKVAVHRLRQRYRERLREEIAHTVAGPDEIEDELRSLFSALSG